MEPLATQVGELIAKNYPGAETDLSLSPSGRVVGSVIYPGFDNQEHIDRQSAVRRYLKQQLGEGIANVGILFLYTPDEMRIMRSA